MVIKCPVDGCDGQGNALNALKGTTHKTHQKEVNCPNRQIGIILNDKIINLKKNNFLIL
jgi:hypothetical protein